MQQTSPAYQGMQSQNAYSRPSPTYLNSPATYAKPMQQDPTFYERAEANQPNYGKIDEVDAMEGYKKMKPAYEGTSLFSGGYGLNSYRMNTTPESQNNSFQIEQFVKPHPQKVTSNEEIMGYIEEVFSYMEIDMPQFSLEICDRDLLKKRKIQFGGIWKEGIQGFCHKFRSMNHIFVKERDLASTMLVVGHELGHAMSPSLGAIDEEAKAYAFSIAWMEVIRVQNIAKLRNYFVVERPAKNGLHNVAYNSVIKVLDTGKKAIELFEDLVSGRTKHINTPEAAVNYG